VLAAAVVVTAAVVSAAPSGPVVTDRATGLRSTYDAQVR
jgi:hypothetical protein